MITRPPRRTIGTAAWPLVAVATLVGCRDAEPPDPTPPEPQVILKSTTMSDAPDVPLSAGDGETLTVLEVDGMTCDGCRGSVHQVLADAPGVTRASVSLDQKRAWVVADAAKAPTAGALLERVTAAGYKARTLDATP